jgi:hypothetical protein
MDRYSIIKGKKYKKPIDWKGKKKKCLQILKSIYYFIYFFIRVDFWLMNERVSPVWDKQLNELMKEHTFFSFRTCIVKLGNYEIWVANYPYAAFTCHYPEIAGRPKRLTILRARKKLKKDIEL